MEEPAEKYLDRCRKLSHDLCDVVIKHTKEWEEPITRDQSTAFVSSVMTSVTLFASDILASICAAQGVKGEDAEERVRKGAELMEKHIAEMALHQMKELNKLNDKDKSGFAKSAFTSLLRH